MSQLDAAFLKLEDEEPRASLAVASVAIFDGPAPSHDAFVDVVRDRLPLVPRYRQKVRQVPFDLGSPVWVDDPYFDIEYHIRRAAVPEPGDEEALCRLASRVMSQRLDRDRPLWEYWVVEGLAGGRWAVLSKVHHCMVDGVSGTNLYTVLLDPTPDAAAGAVDAVATADEWVPEPGPSTLRLATDGLLDCVRSPVTQVGLLVQALRSPRRLLGVASATARGLLELATVLKPASASSLSGPIGQHRRYRMARASLADVIEVARASGASVNDVVLAVIAGAFRKLLLHRGEQPDERAVRSLIPVSVRARGEEGICENRVSLMLAFLPVHLEGVLERLRAVRTRLGELKESGEAEAGAAMTALAGYEPFAPVSWGVRAVCHVPHRNITTVTTNVPGPRRPLYWCGRRMLEVYPYVPIAARLRTGVAVFSYCDTLTFGVTTDYDTAPEADVLVEGIEENLKELFAEALDARM